MEPASPTEAAPPDDVLIVKDDAIIALDLQKTILGFGVKTVRTAASVATALEMIADRAPDFACSMPGWAMKRVLPLPSGSIR